MLTFKSCFLDLHCGLEDEEISAVSQGYLGGPGAPMRALIKHDFAEISRNPWIAHAELNTVNFMLKIVSQQHRFVQAHQCAH